MVKYVYTEDAPAPFSDYSQAVEVPAGKRLVSISGQVGVAPDGALAATEQGQHEQCWRNILAILKEVGMSADDLVDVSGFVTGASGISMFRTVRDRFLGDAKPASTLLIVAGLANPEWMVEITVTAAGNQT